jgi:hypothetical protein
MFILALLSLAVSACVPVRVAQPIPMKHSTDIDIEIAGALSGNDADGFHNRIHRGNPSN